MDKEIAKEYISVVRSARSEIVAPLRTPSASLEDKNTALDGVKQFNKAIRIDPEYRQALGIVAQERKTHFEKKNEIESTFGNSALMEAFSALRRYADPTNTSEKKAKAKKAFYEIADTTFGYNDMSQVVKDNIDTASQRQRETPLTKRYNEISSEMNERYGNVDQLDIHFQFQAHYLFGDKNQEDERNDYESKMRSSFQKGQKNILFTECGISGNQLGKNFQDFFVKYKSASLAFLIPVYDSIIHTVSSKPKGWFMGTVRDKDFTVEQVWEMVGKTGPLKDVDPELAYLQAAFEAADKLRAEGYDIDFKFENTSQDISPHLLQLLNGESSETLEEYRAYKRGTAESNVQRETSIANTICSEAIRAKINAQKTNLLVYLGTVHGSVAQILPSYLDGAIKSAESCTTNMNPMDRLGILLDQQLKHGIEPSPQIWDAMFQIQKGYT